MKAIFYKNENIKKEYTILTAKEQYSIMAQERRLIIYMAYDQQLLEECENFFPKTILEKIEIINDFNTIVYSTQQYTNIVGIIRQIDTNAIIIEFSLASKEL